MLVEVCAAGAAQAMISRLVDCVPGGLAPQAQTIAELKKGVTNPGAVDLCPMRGAYRTTLVRSALGLGR
jgi:hypothetical protein